VVPTPECGSGASVAECPERYERLCDSGDLVLTELRLHGTSEQSPSSLHWRLVTAVAYLYQQPGHLECQT
jgi:hypothetical protein